MIGATSNVADTEGWTTLTLGNNAPTNTASNNHSRGRLRIYSDTSNYTDIYSHSGLTYSKNFYLPNYNDDMYAVHVGDDNAVGDPYTPVYVSENGRVAEVAPIQYFTWQIDINKIGVTLTSTAFSSNSYNI